MRLILKVLALLVIAIVLLAFLGKQIGIEPPIELPDSVDISAPEIPAHLLEKMRIEKNNNKTLTYYKWQDEQGNWHYGEQAPANVKAYPVILGNEIKAADETKEAMPSAPPPN